LLACYYSTSSSDVPISSPFFQNRCFEETDHHHRGVVHYYDGLLPYSSTPTSPPAPTTPSLYAHDVRDDSSGHRLGQPPQQRYWMVGSRSGDGASAEELDLELRL
jgi:hypothetical protein